MDLKSFREDKLRIKTQSEFAELIGVDPSSVCQWETNRESISLPVLEKIMEKTGVTFEELTGWRKPTPKPLQIKDTWKAVDFTKCTLSEYITIALEKMDLPDEYRKAYVEGLRHGIEANSMKPKVAIVGRSDTGKSTLINALLGSDKMSTSWTPTTSIAVYIKHICDRPAFIKDDVWVFANKVGTENLWNERRLYDEAYCRAWKIGAGGIDILQSYGTRQGANYSQQAGAAVIFLNAPILKNCDIVDLPGFGTETESDDNITFTATQKTDVVIYLSQANGFMRIEDITYLKRNINELPVWEKREKNSLKPLSNLFIVASQAHIIGSRTELKNILDNGCRRLLETLPDEYWKTRKKITGYAYRDKGFQELRSRFFLYTIDIPDICSPFNTALTKTLEVFPYIINKQTKAFVRSYVDARKPNLDKEIKKYEKIINERERCVALLNEIEKNELSRTRDNDKRKKDIRGEIDRLSTESMDEFNRYIGETINTDSLARLMREKKVKHGKDDVALFGSFLQSEI